ncbi:MAG: DUF4156 domain-containing protein [Myxococcota bacterium]
MKNLIFPAIFCLSFFTASSCNKKPKVKNAYLHKEAKRVRVIKEYPKHCEPAGSITGRSTYKASGKVVWRYAMNDLRNKAASKGIYTVVLDNHKHSTEGSYLTILLYGKLLKCSEDNKSDSKNESYNSPGSATPPRPKGKMARPRTDSADTNYQNDNPQPTDDNYESEPEDEDEDEFEEEENDNPPPNPDLPRF